MGIGVSGWKLAAAVSRTGALGVVSGVALDSVVARRLQDGDPDGDLRRAFAEFPDQEVASSVLDRYFIPGGRATGMRYRPVPPLTLNPSPERESLSVVAAFAEIYLAKSAAKGGMVGINLLEKIQLATPTAAYGAILAGVDVVLVGAGIPARLPALLNALSRHERVEFPIDVSGSGQTRHALTFDPTPLLGRHLPEVRRPRFIAIVSSHTLATYLARHTETRPDGFVVEGAIAGGHNAPPRGVLQLDEAGEPVYGPRDTADTKELNAIGLPYWLAGGYSLPERVVAARRAGASGVQVGTLFALAVESGISGEIRRQLIEALRDGDVQIRTDPLASPTGYPFKVASLQGTLSEPEVRESRRRVCDLSYLRSPYLAPSGEIGYRCPGEPVRTYLAKGGKRSDTVGRVCLCNGLAATVGLAQRRPGGRVEPPIVTLGADVESARRLLERHPDGWCAQDVISYLTT